MESTSPGFAVELGAVALGAEDFGAAGEGWAAGLWAIANKEPRPKQRVKTAAMSLLMANNLTPTPLAAQTGAAVLLPCRFFSDPIFSDPRSPRSWALPLPDVAASTTADSAGCSRT